MLFVLVSGIVMLTLLDRAVRMDRLDSLMIETRFRLFALRDELRTSIIDGEAPDNKWFEYLDTTLTKAIDSLPHINAWEVAALIFVHRNEPNILHAQHNLMQALAEPENQRIAHIYGKFVSCVAEFMVKRHRTPVVLIKGAAVTAKKAFNIKDRLARAVTTSPETSTLLHYQ